MCDHAVFVVVSKLMCVFFFIDIHHVCGFIDHFKQLTEATIFQSLTVLLGEIHHVIHTWKGNFTHYHSAQSSIFSDYLTCNSSVFLTREKGFINRRFVLFSNISQQVLTNYSIALCIIHIIYVYQIYTTLCDHSQRSFGFRYHWSICWWHNCLGAVAYNIYSCRSVINQELHYLTGTKILS